MKDISKYIADTLATKGPAVLVRVDEVQQKKVLDKQQKNEQTADVCIRMALENMLSRLVDAVEKELGYYTILDCEYIKEIKDSKSKKDLTNEGYNKALELLKDELEKKNIRAELMSDDKTQTCYVQVVTDDVVKALRNNKE
jgi:hypothetical protein